MGAGQKSGQYWALDPDTGAVEWVTTAGPGGTAGGLQWGSAVDGLRVYTADANSDAQAVDDAQRFRRHLWDVERSRRSDRTGALADGATARRRHVRSRHDRQRRRLRLCARCAGAHVRNERSDRSRPVAVRERRLVPVRSGDLRRSRVLGSGYTNFGFGTPNNKLYAFELP